MAIFEGIVEFLVGCFLAGVGAAMGSVGGLWTGWIGSVLGGGIAAWKMRRLSVVVGGAVVSATLGALTAKSWGGVVVLAVWSVGVPATALFPFERTFWFSRKETLLKKRDLEIFLHLAERDPEQFRKRLESLTSSQREQMRQVLRARRRG